MSEIKRIVSGVHTYEVRHITETDKDDPQFLLLLNGSNSGRLVLSADGPAGGTSPNFYKWKDVQDNTENYRIIVWTDDPIVKPEEKMDLLFDMDGVLCDFEAAAIEVLRKNGSTFEPGTREWSDAISDCQDIPGFYRNLPPIEGGIEAFKKLSEYYNCYVCSAPAASNFTSYSDKPIWVRDHIGELAYKKLILTHNKGMHSGRALIDDRIKYNVHKFKGEHIHFGKDIFTDWAVTLDYLLPKDIGPLRFNQPAARLEFEDNALRLNDKMLQIVAKIATNRSTIESLLKVFGGDTIYNQHLLREHIQTIKQFTILAGVDIVPASLNTLQFQV